MICFSGRHDDDVATEPHVLHGKVHHGSFAEELSITRLCLDLQHKLSEDILATFEITEIKEARFRIVIRLLSA